MICMMTHSLINVFSQIIMDGGNPYVTYICKIIIVVISIVLSLVDKSKKKEVL